MDADGRIRFGGKDVTHQFTCPVCNELPEEAVYQCRNGHVICRKCYRRLRKCHVCPKELAQSNPIRNLVAESMLDELKVDCPFQNNGCKTRMYRNRVPNHGAGCLYNFAKFGQLVNLCHKLGYPTCNFKVNDGNTAAAIKHFQSEHGFHLAQAGKFQMELKYFKEAITLKKNRQWTPAIVKLSACQGHLLILPMQNEAKEFTCVSIWFPDPNNGRRRWFQSLLRVEYTMRQRDHSQSCDLSFAQRPVSIAQAANILPGNLPHSIQGQFLTEHMRDEGAMQIICKINQKTSGETAIQGPLRTFICRMKPPLLPVPSTGATEKTEKWIDDAENSSKVDRENLLKFLWELYEEKNNPEGYTAKELDYLKKEAIPVVLRQGTAFQLGYMRAKGCNFEYDFEDGVTNLQYLLLEDKDKKIGLEKVKALVNFGVDSKRISNYGSSVLHFAARFGNEKTVKYVVEELKLDVNALNKCRLTPLHYAVVNKDENCAIKISQLLLDHGANPKMGRDLMEVAKPKYKKKLEKMLRQHREKNLNKNSSV